MTLKKQLKDKKLKEEDVFTNSSYKANEKQMKHIWASVTSDSLRLSW